MIHNKLISFLREPPLINNLTINDYRRQKTLEERLTESANIREKYPDRIPVVCQKIPESKLDILLKTKYLVPKELTTSQFLYIVRKRLKLNGEKGLFLFVNNVIASSGYTISELDQEHRGEDGFLYLSYAEENVFG